MPSGYINDQYRFKKEFTKPLMPFVKRMKEVGFVTFNGKLHREVSAGYTATKLITYHEQDLIYKFRQFQHGLHYAEITPLGLEAVKFELEVCWRPVQQMKRLYKLYNNMEEE